MLILQKYFKIIYNSLKIVRARGGFFAVFRVALVLISKGNFSQISRSMKNLSFRARTYGLDFSYQEWIKNSEGNIIKEFLQFGKLPTSSPTLSIIMPVFKPDLAFLKYAIDSILSQTYDNWELCIVDDGSNEKNLMKFLTSLANEDDRIKIKINSENRHISIASNMAVALSSGEFLILMDQDDAIPEYALEIIAKTIANNPDCALIFTDEDKITRDNVRYDPNFKPDFNYELFLSQNMVSHLGVYRSDVFKDVGGFRAGFEGAQDYDLSFRFIEEITSDQIIHLPYVLYHWRAMPGSTALRVDEKNYALENSRKVVTEHLCRIGVNADVSEAPEAPNYNRVKYRLNHRLPLVSIIIPTRDQVRLLTQCLESLFELTNYPNYEIIIVDNESVESDTFVLFDAMKPRGVRIIRDCNKFNYSRLNNLAADVANGELICLLNNDIEIVDPDWLGEMVSFAVQASIGCVGARLWYPNGQLQHGGVITGIGGVAGHSHKYLPKGQIGYFGRAALHQAFSAVTGACLLVEKKIWDEVGGLDEELAVAFNDVDFCLRVQAKGYRNVWTPYAQLIHHESISRGAEDTVAKQMRFNREVHFMKKRWGKSLVDDNCYNQNLTLQREDFSLKLENS